jgi:hypothetical protein
VRSERGVKDRFCFLVETKFRHGKPKLKAWSKIEAMQTNFDVYFAKLKSEVLSVVEKYVCKCNADNRFVLFLLLCAVR